MVVDAHNHAHDPRLNSVRAGMAKTLATAGLSFAIVNGTREDDWGRVGEVCAADPRLLPSFACIHGSLIKPARTGAIDSCSA